MLTVLDKVPFWVYNWKEFKRRSLKEISMAIRSILVTAAILLALVSGATADSLNFSRLNSGCEQLRSLKTFDCQQRVIEMKKVWGDGNKPQYKVLWNEFIKIYRPVALYGIEVD